MVDNKQHKGKWQDKRNAILQGKVKITVKLATGTLHAMNPHYHPYTELPSPHSPPPDNYHHVPMSNGHLIGGGGPHHEHHPHHHGGLKICGGCGGKIVERFLLHALDRYWHNGCLKCSCCHAMLADIGSSCFTKAGMILCKTDYARA
ncbi:hypothetical protein RUM44_003344 [Polyplax serrata]|uniref:LIM zinc-binding domain-containing protein n=1 Tax=Polyplax serrata TaxID=468196 RepID=A0ABR1AHS4_POLSC